MRFYHERGSSSFFALPLCTSLCPGQDAGPGGVYLCLHCHGSVLTRSAGRRMEAAGEPFHQQSPHLPRAKHRLPREAHTQSLECAIPDRSSPQRSPQRDPSILGVLFSEKPPIECFVAGPGPVFSGRPQDIFPRIRMNQRL